MVSLHERAKDVFLAALEQPADLRRSFIADACATDPALHREVESLLKFHEETGSTNVEDTTTGHPRTDEKELSSVFNPGDVFAYERLEARRANIPRWLEAGVRIVPGSDAGVAVTPTRTTPSRGRPLSRERLTTLSRVSTRGQPISTARIA